MGTIALNRSIRVYLQLRFRNPTVPWLRRGFSSLSSTIRCTESYYSTPQIKKSQVPVSLASLLKKNSKDEPCDGSALEHPETVCSNSPEKRLYKTASSPKRRTKKLVHKDSDAGRPISIRRNVSENKHLETVNLEDGPSCEEKEISNKEISKSLLADAENVAIQLLAGRAFSVAELRKKLVGKKFPGQVVDNVIADIKARGLVNDGLYAESFSQSKWLSGTWGPRRIKQALLQKGVSEADANKAMRKVFEHNDIDSIRSDYAYHNYNHESNHLDENEANNAPLTMSESSMDHLFIQASKQWLRGQNLSTESRKTRVVRWLQYRGFNWGVASVILKRLESQYPNAEDDSNINYKKSNYGTRGSSTNKSVEERGSEESVDKLFVEVSKQWIKGRDTSIENRKARITRWLHYRGYSWEVIKVMLKRLQSQ